MLDSFTANATRGHVDLTGRSRPDGMDEGGFRQDLFYRLGGVTISVPGLRERVDDIPLLVRPLPRARRARRTLRPRVFSSDANGPSCAPTAGPETSGKLGNAVASDFFSQAARKRCPRGGRTGTRQSARWSSRSPAARTVTSFQARCQAPQALFRIFTAKCFRRRDSTSASSARWNCRCSRSRSTRRAGNQAKCAELLGIKSKHTEKEDHRSRYSRDTPPQVDV